MFLITLSAAIQDSRTKFYFRLWSSSNEVACLFFFVIALVLQPSDTYYVPGALIQKPHLSARQGLGLPRPLKSLSLIRP